MAGVIENSKRKGGMLLIAFQINFLLEELVGPEKDRDVVRKKEEGSC